MGEREREVRVYTCVMVFALCVVCVCGDVLVCVCMCPPLLRAFVPVTRITKQLNTNEPPYTCTKYPESRLWLVNVCIVLHV